MRLLLIRHGQTPSNVIGALDTARPGPGLTSLGHAQASAIPRVLVEERIDAVYASVLTRTQLTAQPLATARGLDVQVREGFEEILAGDVEMRVDAASVQAYVEAGWRWIRGDLDHTLAGGESGHDFFARYDAAIAEAAQHQTAAVVSHGAAIRIWAARRARNIASDAVRGLHNTGMCVLEGDPTGWTLREWREDPLGGIDLEDQLARDVTGDPEDVVSHP